MRTQDKFNCCGAKAQRDGKSRQLKTLRQKNSRLEKRFNCFVDRVATLEDRYQPYYLPGHRYPLQLITLAIMMVTQANASLRCTAKTVSFMAQLLGWPCKQPSPTTIANWAQRAGLYVLEHQLAKPGEEYVGIIDESAQIGGQKILLLLGYPLKLLRNGIKTTLKMGHVKVLGLEVRKSWRSDKITEWVTERIEKLECGIKYLVCDSGTNLMASVRQLRADRVSDCTHVLMNILKKEWAPNPNYKSFIDNVQRLRGPWSMTELAFLLPAKLRRHDRFCHLFVLTKWASQLIDAWDVLPEKARNKLGFVKSNPLFINQMKQARDLVELTTKLLKTKGLSRVTEVEWLLQIAIYQESTALYPIGNAIVGGMKNYFGAHRELWQCHGSLICYSDIIESIFGKYKNKGGPPMIGPDVLYIPLYGMQITRQLIHNAFSAVDTNTLEQWKANKLCENRYSTDLRLRKLVKVASR